MSGGARSIILDQAFASKDRPACLPFLHVGTRGAAAERPAESAARAANIPIAELCGRASQSIGDRANVRL